jgi:hypothetical protein
MLLSLSESDDLPRRNVSDLKVRLSNARDGSYIRLSSKLDVDGGYGRDAIRNAHKIATMTAA